MEKLDLTADLDRVNETIANILSHEAVLLGPISSHILTCPGKRIRTKLVLATAQLNACPLGPTLYRRAAAIELLHAATLLHDDIIDQGEERRGRPAAYRVWGHTPSLLAGDYLFTKAFELVLSESTPTTGRLLNQTAAQLIEGEALQYAHRGNITMHIDTYFQITRLKTAALFATASVIGLEKKCLPFLQAYGEAFGVLFQLQNDQKDWGWGGGSEAGRAGSDIRAKQITLPALLSYQHGTPEIQMFWENLMIEESVTSTHIETALMIMSSQKIETAMRPYQRQYAQRAREALEHIPNTPLKDYLFHLLEGVFILS